ERADRAVAHLTVRLGEQPANERRGGFGAGDPCENLVEQLAERGAVFSEHADQGCDRNGLVDLMELLLRLLGPFLGSGGDRLAEQLEPPRPRRLLGAGGRVLLALVAVFLGDPLATVANEPLRLAQLIAAQPAVAVEHVAELLVRRRKRLVLL